MAAIRTSFANTTTGHKYFPDMFLFLTVDPPKIIQHPESQSVVTGTPVAFTVEATGDDLQFLWQKDGKNIDRNGSRLHCSQTDNTSTLHIQHVKKSDQGHYRCLVKNPVEESRTNSDVAKLIVSEFFVCLFACFFFCLSVCAFVFW